MKIFSLKFLACASLWLAPVISMMAQSYTFSTLAGTAGIQGGADGNGAAASFNNPYGIAIDNAGNVYVADTGNNIIRKIAISGGVGAVSTLAGTAGVSGTNDGMGGQAQFNQPAGIAADSMGNLYVADTGNHTIRKIVISSRMVSTLAGKPGESDYPNMGPPIFPNLGPAVPGSDARFGHPHGVACDGAGNVYVADTENHAIRKITNNPVTGLGMVTTVAGGLPGGASSQNSNDGVGTNAGFNAPYGIAVDGLGTLYVADELHGLIRKIIIDPATGLGTVTTLAGKGLLANPAAVAVDGMGNVYVADQGNSVIRKISNGQVTTVAGTLGQGGSTDGVGTDALFASPYGIAVDGSGNLYVADTRNNTIRLGKPLFTLTTSNATIDGCGSTCCPTNVVMFTTDPNYSWTAVSDSSWLHVLDPSGTGSGTVHYSVDPNTTMGPRTGTITIAGQTFTVTQVIMHCSFLLQPLTFSIHPPLPPSDFAQSTIGCDGTPVAVKVVTREDTDSCCPWTAIVTTGGTWLRILYGTQSGQGNGIFVAYAYPNTTGTNRTGTITVGNVQFVVTEEGCHCSYKISPSGITHNRGAFDTWFHVEASCGCNWTAVASDPWIHLANSSGTGNDLVEFGVDAAMQDRSGTITVEGQTFKINQAKGTSSGTGGTTGGGGGVSRYFYPVLEISGPVSHWNNGDTRHD